MKQLFVINNTVLDNIWSYVKPFIEMGLQHSDGEITVDQIRMCLVSGAMKLLVSKDIGTQEIKSVLVVEIIPYPNYRCANIVCIGGKNLWMDDTDVAQLRRICADFGASKIQGYVRPSVAKYLSRRGFSKKYEVVRLDVKD